MELNHFIDTLEHDLFCQCNNCKWKQTLTYGLWMKPDEVVLLIRNAHKDFNSECDEKGKEDIHVTTEAIITKDFKLTEKDIEEFKKHGKVKRIPNNQGEGTSNVGPSSQDNNSV